MNIKLLFASCLSLLMLGAKGQALVGGSTYPVNGTHLPPTSFGTLQQVATYLKDSGVTGTGNIIVQLQTGYNPASEPASGVTFDTIMGANASRRVIVRPAAAYTTTITGTVNGAGVLNLVRTKFLTVDGRQGGTGSIGLTITNSSTSSVDSTSTIYFGLDAQNNVIRYCNLTGSSKSSAFGGMVYFGRGIATGNSFNTIEYCDLNGLGACHNGICNNGTMTSPTTQNNGDTIRFCNVYDFFNTVTTSGNIGIRIQQGASNWVIEGNHIYQTVSRTYTAQLNNSGINIGVGSAFTSDAHRIVNNFIGGSGPNCTGMLVANSTTQVIGWNGIVINGGLGTVVSGNTIKNISVTFNNTAGSFTNVGISVAYTFSGNVTISNNTIDSFMVNNNSGGSSAGACVVNGIQIQSTVSTAFIPQIAPSTIIENNTISNIMSITNSTAVNAIGFGVRLNVTTNGSQNGTATSASNNMSVRLNGNTIHSISTTGVSAASYAYGVWGNSFVGSGASNFTLRLIPKIENNTIRNISSSGAIVSAGFPTAGGISILNAGASLNTGVYTDTLIVNNNNIYNIYGTNSAQNAYSNYITGVSTNLGRVRITSNKIYNIYHSAKDSTTTPYICGINILNVAAASTIANNFVSVGDTATQNYGAFGIAASFSTNEININNNTVLIGGTATTKNSAAILRGDPLNLAATTTNVNIRNNLAINRRTGGGINVALALPGTSIFTSNNNVFVNASANTLYYNATSTNLSGWVTATANDAYSYEAVTGVTTSFTANPATINLTDLFNNASYASVADFQIKTTNAASWLAFGKGLSGISTTDYYGNARSSVTGTPVCIGAHEFTTSTISPACAVSGNIATNDSSMFWFAGRNIAKVKWNSGTLPSAVTGRYYSGVDHSVVTPGNKAKSYWEISGTGGSGYNTNVTINYGPHETGNISNGSASTKLAIFNGTGWSYLGAGATANINSSPQSVVINGIGNFFTSSVAFTLTDNTSPLPVELLNLNGALINKYVALTWATASELNNSGFEVEQSTDGLSFKSIGFVKGAETTNSLSQYQYADYSIAELNSKVVYYRLKQVDLDGKFNYSNTISVNLNQVPSTIGIIVPNPFSSDITVTTTIQEKGTAVISVTDLSGKEVAKGVYELSNGIQTISLNNLDGLDAGVYLLSLSINGHQETRKIIKTTK